MNVRFKGKNVLTTRFLVLSVWMALLFLGPLSGSAAIGAPWDGTVEEPTWVEDNGYYEIATPQQLAGFRDWINSGQNRNESYMLTDDIDLGGRDWTPIGMEEWETKSDSSTETLDAHFEGLFDGGGHTIKNFNIVSDDYAFVAAGLFGVVKSQKPQTRIANLHVSDFVIQVGTTLPTRHLLVGGLVGDVGESVVIADCSSSGEVRVEWVAAERDANVVAGGLVGRNLGQIATSLANVLVSAKAESGGGKAAVYAGGLVGGSGTYQYWGVSGEIRDCIASGDVTATAKAAGKADTDAGGLVGYNHGSIRNSHASGAVTTFGEGKRADIDAGGLVGWNRSGWLHENYARGAVSADAKSTAEIVTATAGGLVGRNDRASITSSNASGAAEANALSDTGRAYSSAGGLVGGTEDIRLRNKLLQIVRTASGHVSISINKCFATGDAYANAETGTNNAYSVAGGLVGGNRDTMIGNSFSTGSALADGSSASGESFAYSGGLVGANNIGGIVDCYAYGTFLASDTAGGFAGGNDKAITRCYWLNEGAADEAKGIANDVGGIDQAVDVVSLDKSGFRSENKATFTNNGWDFEKVWDYPAGADGSMPLLRAHTLDGTPIKTEATEPELVTMPDGSTWSPYGDFAPSSSSSCGVGAAAPLVMFGLIGAVLLRRRNN